MRMIEEQIRRGGLFLHEHPCSATSLGLDCVVKVRGLKGVSVAYGDQCAFGLVVPDAHGDSLARTPTG